MAFKKAERLLTNPTIAITGPTGSGKTFSGLRLAAGIAKQMGGRFAVIDAENGSASLYSEFFDFDTLNLMPPFTTEKYIDAIQEAEKAGYCAVLCDSITHAWAGEGGLLEQKAQLDSRPGTNHWTNWNPIKAKDQRFKNAYLHSSIPFFIATMRSKMEYAQSEDNGKKKIQKMGMAPVQSDGIEYEFSLVFDVAMNHECEVSKDRTHLFDKNPIFKITEETGEMLVKWRSSSKQEVKVVVEKLQPVRSQHKVETQNIPAIKNYAPESSPVKESPSELDAVLSDVGNIEINWSVCDHFPENEAEVLQKINDYKITFGEHNGKRLVDMDPNHLSNIAMGIEKLKLEKPVTYSRSQPAFEKFMIVSDVWFKYQEALKKEGKK